MKIIRTLQIFLLICNNIPTVNAADTIYVSPNFHVDSFSFVHPDGSYYFVNKIIRMKSGDSIPMFSHFIAPQGFDGFSLLFRKCIINDNDLINLNKSDSIISGDFVFDRSRIDNLTLNKINGHLEFFNSYSAKLYIINADRLKIKFNNMASQEIIINQCSNLYLEFSNHFNKESSKFTVSNSKIKYINFDIIDKYGNSKYEFKNDTINNLQFFNGQTKDPIDYKFESYANEIIFRNCYIANPIDFKSRAPDTKIRFINCTFGPEVNLTNLRIDQLALDNSPNIPKPLKISFATDSIWGQISLVNTEVSHLDIAWTDKIWLYFDSIETEEVVDRTCNLLLDKYKAELKTDNYRRIDLMHHYYSEGDFFWSLDNNWWGHGYDKNRVFTWTALLLLLFTITNYVWWPKMQSTYALFPMERVFSFRSVLTLKSIFASFLYSAFIFFSLSIKLDKLKLDSTPFVICFFIEYLSGLFCLLFIVKAVLKW